MKKQNGLKGDSHRNLPRGSQLRGKESCWSQIKSLVWIQPWFSMWIDWFVWRSILLCKPPDSLLSWFSSYPRLPIQWEGSPNNEGIAKQMVPQQSLRLNRLTCGPLGPFGPKEPSGPCRKNRQNKLLLQILIQIIQHQSTPQLVTVDVISSTDACKKREEEFPVLLLAFLLLPVLQ